MQRPVHDWVMVKIAGHKAKKIWTPQGDQTGMDVYVEIIDAGPLAKMEESGINKGDIALVPRIVAPPGLEWGWGLVKCSDLFYVTDGMPEGITPGPPPNPNEKSNIVVPSGIIVPNADGSQLN